MQWAERDLDNLLASNIDKLVCLIFSGWLRAEAVIHGIFSQGIEDLPANRLAEPGGVHPATRLVGGRTYPALLARTRSRLGLLE